MNAHTSDLPDFVSDENITHIDFLPDGYVADTACTVRCSQDKGRINNNGIVLLDLCKQTGMRILNGRCDRDQDGKNTFIGRTGSSVVDYVIATPGIFTVFTLSELMIQILYRTFA